MTDMGFMLSKNEDNKRTAIRKTITASFFALILMPVPRSSIEKYNAHRTGFVSIILSLSEHFVNCNPSHTSYLVLAQVQCNVIL